MKKIWKEIKEAFPFWWGKRICGVYHSSWEMDNRILKVGLVIPTTEEINKDIEDKFNNMGLDPNSVEANILKENINSWYKEAEKLYYDVL